MRFSEIVSFFLGIADRLLSFSQTPICFRLLNDNVELWEDCFYPQKGLMVLHMDVLVVEYRVMDNVPGRLNN